MSHQNTDFGKRRLLGLLGVLASTTLFSILSSTTNARNTEWKKRLKDIVKEFKPVEGKVSIQLPKIASHGNAVPVTVTVESPMTETEYIENIILMSNYGKSPTLGRFFLSSDSGKAEVTTYLKLSRDQEIMALAKTSSGKFYIGRRQATITLDREF